MIELDGVKLYDGHHCGGRRKKTVERLQKSRPTG